MGAAMGYILKKIPPDFDLFKAYSHWSVIHTDWGLCKLLIPIKLDENVIVKIYMFGTTNPEEVTFKGQRTEDVEEFVKMVEERLTNAITKYAESELQKFLEGGGRLQ